LTVTDTLRVTGDIKWTGKTLTDTFALVAYPTGVIDTAQLYEPASWALKMQLKSFDKEYTEVMKRGELCLPLKQGSKINDKYKLMKPYTASDVQLQAEIEKLYRRVYDMNKRLESLEKKRMKKIKYYKAL
jgi:hypothetical protein